MKDYNVFERRYFSDIASMTNDTARDILGRLERAMLASRSASSQIREIIDRESRANDYDGIYLSDPSIRNMLTNGIGEESRTIPYDNKIWWMRKEGVLNRFIKNMKKKRHYNTEQVKEYIDKHHENLLSSAFGWDRTDEGYNFWCDKDYKFTKWYLRIQ